MAMVTPAKTESQLKCEALQSTTAAGTAEGGPEREREVPLAVSTAKLYLEKASHAPDLTLGDHTSVYIDWMQMGVGGDDTWSERGRPHDEHRIKAKKQRFSFRISPLEGKKGGIEKYLGYE